MPPERIITLTTDFGLEDAYVAVMKAVILGIAPGTRLVDISHHVHAQDVNGASYLLYSACRYFPSNTIHLAVVDPGVGTARRAIAVVSAHGFFVGPDNGIFAPALAHQGGLDVSTGSVLHGRAVELANDKYRLGPVSRTFHGRDIFAPAAAHLAAGIALSELGPTVDQLEVGGYGLPVRTLDTVSGRIVHIDHFGNAISNIPAKLVADGSIFGISGRTIRGLAHSYQDAHMVAIVGSNDTVEIAVRDGSAADVLGLHVGDVLTVRSDR
jgi:S-adenosyl-L-methionine hydrolase (adenosine-forming)